MSHSSAWIILFFAGLLEIGWAIGLKYSEGFSKPIPSVLTISAMILSMFLLGKATAELPIGTAYGVWVGIGTVGASILGIILFKESASAAKLIFLAMLITSIIGLKLTSES